jgi:hypothetical protein
MGEVTAKFYVVRPSSLLREKTEFLVVVLMGNVNNKTAIPASLLAFMAVFLFLVPATVLGMGINCPESLSGVVTSLDASQRGSLVLGDSTLALLADNAMGVSRDVTIDLETDQVLLRESAEGVGLGLPLVISLDEYLRLRSQHGLGDRWRNINRTRLEQEKQADGRSLFQIDIPVKFPKAIRSIVGEGGPGLKVTGMRRISFAGRSEWTEGLQQTATSKPSKFPSLNMEQKSRFTIEGTVGSKIIVSVDQDSERDNELENNIQLRYTGEEDEIIQEIQAGNTTLALPNTEFVGYSENVKGLFGVKAKAQVGNLNLITIASQEKGSGASGTFSAGAQADSSIIRDYQYKARSRYFLDHSYRGRYWDQNGWYNLQTGIHGYASADSVTEIFLYVDDRNAYNNDEEGGTIRAVAYEYQGQQDPYTGDFNELEEEVDFTVDRRTGYLAMKTPLQSNHVLAIRYKTKTSSLWWDEIIPPDTTINLKLLKPNDPDPNDPSWDLEWRNIYDLRTRDISNTRDFHIKIFKEIPSQPSQTIQPEDGTPLLQIFGLDLHNEYGDTTLFDDEVDLDRYLVDLSRGELIFPDHRPFAPDTAILEGKVLIDQIPAIYDSDYDRDKVDASRYYIKVEFINKKTTYSLGHMNVIEGSVVVTANGERLQEGIDYSVIYEIGQISLLSEKATNPNAAVSVNFDYAPFFMPAQKTLLGTRAEYYLSESAEFGATALFRREKTLEQKPRVGQEPTRTFIWDADMALKFKPSFMTSMVNAIPLVESDKASALNIFAEVAQSLPNPNTLGEAYIDDFEGSKEALNLSVMRTAWTKSSAPLDDGNSPLPDSSGRGRLIWYNPWDRVYVREIWPKKETLSEESRIHTLNLEFTPDTNLSAAPEEQWGGLIRYLSQGFWDQRRSKYLEVWVKGNRGILTVDLGLISEDIDEDRVLDTEDIRRNGVRDGILDEDEDTGLDGVFGRDGSDVLGDDGDDDWHYGSEDRYNYSRINGTEGNADDPDAGRRPDTEDLDRSGYLEMENGYFQFSIDLASDVNQVPDTESNGWRLYRIALRDTINAPWYGKKGTAEVDWQSIKFARLWISGVVEPAMVQIASLEIVGNKWEELGVATLDSLSQVGLEESFDLAVKNTHENEDYRPPPGVTAEKDQATNLPKREQSLVLKFSNLKPDHYGAAERIVYSREDYTGYGELRMFVHGSEELSPGDLSRVEFYLRLGDSENDFYEFHTPVYYSSALWDSRNEVIINFEKITGLKDALQRRIQGVEGGVPDTTFGNYRIRGRPSLSSIKWFEVGVINRSTETVSGEIWLDEMRVTDVRRVPGWAGRASVNASFADFATLSYSFHRKDSEFHGLREKKGSGLEATNQNIRASLNLDKFLPASWGFNLPVRGSWSKDLRLPRLKPGSDIVLPKDLREQDRTETVSRTANISFSKRKTSGIWIVAWTLERLSANLALADKKGRNPTFPVSNSSSYEAGLTYDLSPEKHPTLSPFGWMKSFLPKVISGTEFSFLPDKINLSSSLSRRRTYQVDRSNNLKTQFNRDLSNRGELGMTPLKSLKLGYTFSNVMDLRNDAQIDLAKLKLGIEINRKQTASLSYKPTIFSWLSHSYSYRADYQENNDPNSGASGGRTVGLRNSQSIEASLNWKQLFGSPRKAEGGLTPGSPAWVVYQLRSLGGRIDPLRGNYQIEQNISQPGLVDRPSWMFQLGLSDQTGVSQNPLVSQNNREGITYNWSLKSGVALIPGIDLGAGYKFRDVVSRAPDKADETQSVGFPDITVRWNNLNKLGPLKLFMKSASLDFGYSRKIDKKGDEGLKSLVSKGVTQEFSPLFSWTARWRDNLSTTLKSAKSQSEIEIYRGSATTTKREERTNSFNINYSFSSPGGIHIPLLGRIKFTSTLNISLDISTRETLERTALQNMGFNTKTDLQELRIQPTASYSFSKNVTGGLNALWMNSDDKKTNQKRRVRELGFWTELRF